MMMVHSDMFHLQANARATQPHGRLFSCLTRAVRSAFCAVCLMTGLTGRAKRAYSRAQRVHSVTCNGLHAFCGCLKGCKFRDKIIQIFPDGRQGACAFYAVGICPFGPKAALVMAGYVKQIVGGCLRKIGVIIHASLRHAAQYCKIMDDQVELALTLPDFGIFLRKNRQGKKAANQACAKNGMWLHEYPSSWLKLAPSPYDAAREDQHTGA